jgi:hypothetical protein
VIWVCLRVLILHYQSVMPWARVIWYFRTMTLRVRWTALLDWMGESETDCNYPVFQPLHNLARHLYNTLTAIYSALYRTTSPLTLDWRTDEISELLDKDPDLIRLFCDIKMDMYWFRRFFQRADARKLIRTNECNFQIARKIDFIQGMLCSRRLS